jgi:NhaA family Na+:H+ antiporter
MSSPSADRIPRLPEASIDRWLRPFSRFLHVEAASGVILLGCAVIALAAANSPLADLYHAFWHAPISISLAGVGLEWSLAHWINDALMTIFFFVVGLEIKREFVAGQLRDPRQAALPVAAALGGMVAPAFIYLSLQLGEPGERGWGIPVATDIAFVVGVMAILGQRVPHGLKIVVLALAIVDDIGAILVIAIGYSQDVGGMPLAFAAVGFGACALMNRVGVRWIPAYVVVGSGIWLAFVMSGVHPTVAGVLLGLMTPASALIGQQDFIQVATHAVERIRRQPWEAEDERHVEILNLASQATETVPPLERLETAMHPWVAFGIMPLFALANAGVHFDTSELFHPVENAVSLGLIVGKPLGIVLASWLAVRVGLARLPLGVNWKVMLGAGCLGGIGFTMSLFVANLALDTHLLDAAKIGVFSGSLVSAILGSVVLLAVLPSRAPGPEQTIAALGAEESA